MTDENMQTELEKLDLHSLDVAEAKRHELLQLLPEVRTEGGKIDFDRLKAVLGEMVDVGRERYSMNWPGKAECMRTIQSPSIATLLPSQDESVDWDTTDNLIIEGDNLEVLKLLQKSYLGKVKMIYIDPPYNTGNDFIYPDNYSESLQTYLEYTGQTDEQGRKFSTNTDTDGRYHSKWLNMMYPRLYLARNLLREDGVIFISIDDTEDCNLRRLTDELFGEENLIGQFIWKSRQNKDNRNTTGASIDHEYVVCYGRELRGSARDITQYSNPDNDPRGDWASGNMVGILGEDKRPNCHFDLYNPETDITYPKPRMGWRYDRATMTRLIEEQRILWPAEASGRPRRKVFLSELRAEFTGYSSVIATGIYTRDGTAELEELFGRRVMEFPKPVRLLRELIEQGAHDPDSIIMDFFAGSGATAQAVSEINAEDGGSRRYVLVQLPEPLLVPVTLDDGTTLHTIADICRERVRRAVKQIKAKGDSSHDINGKAEQDLGFRAFRLAESNFKPWDTNGSSNAAELTDQLAMHVDHVRHDRTSNDILYEVLLKAGFPLTTRVEETQIAGKQVFSVAEGALIICLEHELNLEVVRGIADLKPERVVMLDSGFVGKDQLKTNAVQAFKTKGVASFKVV